MKLTKKDLEAAWPVKKQTHNTRLRLPKELYERVLACKHKLGDDTMSLNEFYCSAIELVVKKLEK